MQFQGVDGAMRFLDGTGTPRFFEMVFENMDISFPLGPPEPEQRPVLHRGRFDENWHYIAGPDRPEPLAVSFSFNLATTDPARQKMRDMMGLDLPATWTVGGVTWVTTKGKTQRLSGDPTRTLVTTPALATGRMYCVNMELLLTDPSGGASHIGYRIPEIYFPPDQQNLGESGDAPYRISCSGLFYGQPVEITAFSAGLET